MIGFKLVVAVTCLAGLIAAQDHQDHYRQAPLRIGTKVEEPKPTPVPILKQINRHNEDGSYTYGYEGADGSFKIETKLATGEVKGKYGYVDETGKVKVVEYGANKYGFQPSGEGITVPPPTLVDETTGKDDLLDADGDGNVPLAPRHKHRPSTGGPSKPRFQEVVSKPQPRPQYYDYDDQPQPAAVQHQQHQQHQQQQPARYQPAPEYIQRSHFGPAAQAHHEQGPAPPRAHIPNAVPIDVVYSPKQLPARPDAEYRNVVGPHTFPAPAPAPEQQQLQQQQQQQQHIRYSQPSFAPAPQHAPKAAPQQPAVYQPRPAQGRSTSVLDQLAKDYALPQGGAAPLHDITFGYY
ncbi:trithorax group protein osa isoform X2 [Anopheles bellator]|uniref:trithorax group protein osa isoform X2 n=1 Tax=Anopheles bellator TaxID=139047 RepID=UPI002649CC6F|nr:trithorax group protein osa isoform X2 [Anopheles bellator]